MIPKTAVIVTGNEEINRKSFKEHIRNNIHWIYELENVNIITVIQSSGQEKDHNKMALIGLAQSRNMGYQSMLLFSIESDYEDKIIMTPIEITEEMRDAASRYASYKLMTMKHSLNKDTIIQVTL